MKLISRLLVIFVAISTMYGCASNVMVASSTPEIKPPSNGNAQIVFMRSSFVAGAINVDLFEVVDGKLKFIGVVSNKTKIAYQTTPGEKTFMAYGTAADFMKANVVAGKTYFSILRPNWGTGGFAPTPIRKQGEWSMQHPDFNSWLNDTDLVVPKEEAKAYFEQKKPQFEEIYKDYWARFQNKAPHEVAERTLNPQDGK